MDVNWVADGLAQYLRSPMWTAPISNFVDDNCIYFDSEAEMKLEYTPIHKQFQELVDALLTGYIGELGVSAEAALDVIRQSEDETHKRLVEYLTYLDDFASFKKLMEKRNVELDLQAMKELNVAEQGGDATKPSEDDANYARAVEESRHMAELILKEAEMEDLELQKALALSLAMEQERITREREAASAPSAAQPPAPTAPAVEVEELQRKNMDARVKNLEEATRKIAEIQATPAKAAPATAAGAPAVAPSQLEMPTTTIQQVAQQAPAPAVNNAPAVVRLTATTDAPTATIGGLAPIGRKPLSDPTSFKALPGISFRQLQETTPAAQTVAQPTALKGPSMEEVERRAKELRKQRDLIIAMKKKERNEELEAAGGTVAEATPANDELARQKQMAIEIARRFREDLVGESRK